MCCVQQDNENRKRRQDVGSDCGVGEMKVSWNKIVASDRNPMVAKDQKPSVW